MNANNGMVIDVLSTVLSISKMGNAVICESRLPAPWGMKFEPAAKSMFQIIRRGTCYLQTDNMQRPARLMQGDIVLLTKCNGHTLTYSDTEDVKIEPFRKVLERFENIQYEIDTTRDITDILCGVYYFQNFESNPVLAQLPEFIHLSADDVQKNVKLQSLIQLLSLESNRAEIGSDATICRFVDVMFIYIIRAWLQQQSRGVASWLGALSDSGVGQAISLIHNEPHHKWTIGLLADQVNMSRSSFAKKFNTLVGETPLTYLTKWRMDLSAKMLMESDQKLAAIASAVGYESETAFSKTFRKYKNMAPGEYRIKNR